MENTHDPYLTTAKITLKQEQIKLRREKVKKEKAASKSFLSQNVYISDYIYLPESLKNLFLLVLFVIVPYTIGVIAMTVVGGAEGFHEYTKMIFDVFMFTWTMGYETLAIFLLLLIFKSALTFKPPN